MSKVFKATVYLNKTHSYEQIVEYVKKGTELNYFDVKATANVGELVEEDDKYKFDFEMEINCEHLNDSHNGFTWGFVEEGEVPKSFSQVIRNAYSFYPVEIDEIHETI